MAHAPLKESLNHVGAQGCPVLQLTCKMLQVSEELMGRFPFLNYKESVG